MNSQYKITVTNEDGVAREETISSQDLIATMQFTLEHVYNVQKFLLEAINALQKRSIEHDQSKFSTQEFETYAYATKRMGECTFGTDAYRQMTHSIGGAIRRHKEVNRHHPEFHPNGIRDMNLIDLIEMLADWKAAGLRPGGKADLMYSIETCQKRFGYDDNFKQMLVNTAKYLGWINN